MDTIRLDTDVLIIGAGGAGMSAALSAAQAGARVLLTDRSLIGRGGATIMAQMTVAVALGEETADSTEAHLTDTISAGRGLCDPALAAIVCENGPEAIRRLDAWNVGWARGPNGRIRQAHAPGHDRPRCVYVDFLSTGPAVSRTLRAQVQRNADAITRIGDLLITDIAITDGQATGATGYNIATGTPVHISAAAVIIASGGLTRLYRRNSASANMGGDGYALALRAGADLLDMEFVQFFPIGHLAPRLIGMDPIMWDPFRYKLGGRLLNSEGREFLDDHGLPEDGRYIVSRDKATHAILKEVEAGRGSPHNGAWLSFRHVPETALREAFGPVIDRLARNGIDLTRQDIEVAPIAHYHMGGIKVDTTLRTRIPGLFAAGEAVGGSNGANRLSGNAITEALVFGHLAGQHAARHAAAISRPPPPTEADLPSAGTGTSGENPAAGIAALQAIMADQVGPSRTETGLRHALDQIAALRATFGDIPPNRPAAYDPSRLDWFDLRTMLLTAETVAIAALCRTESRGAHQRDDHPCLSEAWSRSQTITLRNGHPSLQTA